MNDDIKNLKNRIIELEKRTQWKRENEWCDGKGLIVYTDKKTRCSKCGRRLKPRESESKLFHTLPPHKKKGYKIKRKKGHNKNEKKTKWRR